MLYKQQMEEMYRNVQQVLERPRGAFVVLEGPDGVGKSTLAKRLANRVRLLTGVRPYVTAQPNNPTLRRWLQDKPDPVTSMAIHLLDRIIHINSILGILQDQRWVICSRYLPSAWVYNPFINEPWYDDESFMRVLEAFAKNVEPDLTIVLDAPVDVIAQRLRNKQPADVVSEDDIQVIRERYLQLAQKRGYPVVDTSGSIRVAVSRSMELLEPIFAKRLPASPNGMYSH